ncbi:hypothetical protein BABINDRAFT_78886 [Babjeviella inositovora NRRL Y-12698]|uniref:Uncharacterized protein n=1 Tax=Babjeviella inositovora NRRL Y-12698 TaxID=984486 RepID=A0A1E3QZB5_9ASCO|nr:uncharacterized protein BABINDRAFT_78886 [Babjeviella inositovora NRRL Y-12698]ODQ82951.1 hypothetical protein BABINDRAFT_78886 [Babjeviella inositovora NRRL Y-12698]
MVRMSWDRIWRSTHAQFARTGRSILCIRPRSIDISNVNHFFCIKPISWSKSARVYNIRYILDSVFEILT